MITEETLRAAIARINMQVIANEGALDFIPSSAGGARHALQAVEKGAVMAVEHILNEMSLSEREFATADAYRLRTQINKSYGLKKESPVLRDERMAPRKATKPNGKAQTA